MSGLHNLASIDKKGAVLLGDLLSCDGVGEGKKHFCFSHIHVDHVGGGTGGVCLGDNVYDSFHLGQVFVSIPTGELLEAIADDNFSGKSQYHTIEYGKKGEQDLNLEGIIEKLQVIESSHMLGASQILLYSENHDKHVLYSGDISSKDRPPRDVDVLVVDSTHGNPYYNYEADEENIRKEFFGELKEQLFTHHKSIAIHGSRGILQEVMSLVSKEPSFDNFELLSTKQDIAASLIYKKYGYHMRNIVERKSEEGEEIRDEMNDNQWIEFTASPHKTAMEKYGAGFGIYFDSYVAGGHKMIKGDGFCRFKQNSHANFDSLINYIESANADLVIVDGYRTQQGSKLVEELKIRDINTECQPIFG